MPPRKTGEVNVRKYQYGSPVKTEGFQIAHNYFGVEGNQVNSVGILQDVPALIFIYSGRQYYSSFLCKTMGEKENKDMRNIANEVWNCFK